MFTVFSKFSVNNCDYVLISVQAQNTEQNEASRNKYGHIYAVSVQAEYGEIFLQKIATIFFSKNT